MRPAGTSADIIKIAMIKIDKYIIDEGLQDKIKMLLTVHDELVFEVEESIVSKVRDKIVEIMEVLFHRKKPMAYRFWYRVRWVRIGEK